MECGPRPRPLAALGSCIGSRHRTGTLSGACIVFGSALTMKVEYHMLDEKGFPAALGAGLKELATLWRNTGS